MSLRLITGLSYNKLAKKFNVHASTLSHFESGKHCVSMKLANQIYLKLLLDGIDFRVANHWIISAGFIPYWAARRFGQLT